MKKFTVRQIHRWLATVLAIQIAIWGVSGAYMVWMKLSYIHGHHLAQEAELPTRIHDPSALQQVIAEYPDAASVTWVNRGLPSHPGDTIEIRRHGERLLLSAESLLPIQPSRTDIQAIAERIYRQSETPEISSITFLHAQGPRELAASHLPVWQVQFDDWVNTTLYLKAETGELVTRRFSFWRGFDVFWMLHIMDYKERENIQTPWLLAITALTLGFVVTGGILLSRRLSVNRRRRMPA